MGSMLHGLLTVLKRQVYVNNCNMKQRSVRCLQHCRDGEESQSSHVSKLSFRAGLLGQRLFLWSVFLPMLDTFYCSPLMCIKL